MADRKETVRRRSIRKASQSSYIVSRNAKIELREKVKKVSEILKKPEHERTAADKALVSKHPEIVKTSEKNAKRLQASKDRLLEIEDESNLLLRKCEKLAELIKSSKHVVVYTGAGISTAASIPDYRGPNGVWTLLKKGQELSPQDLSDAEPTFTHMALSQLYRVGKVKYIVSQNCDGLHMRSWFPRHALSEVHGNMFIECCYNCAPHKEFIRLFDVTERTGVHRHTTARHCKTCGGSLKDTIVHFGEKGKLISPYRWKEAVKAAKNSDLILCLGSSLKVLRKYTCLWCMDKKPSQRPKLVIVNLQWTPKDDVATLKINGQCDTVMTKVMKLLDFEVPEYEREKDPIFKMYTPLRASELKTTNKKILIAPPRIEAASRGSRMSRGKVSNSHTPKRSSKKDKFERKTPLESSGIKCEIEMKSETPASPSHNENDSQSSYDVNKNDANRLFKLEDKITDFCQDLPVACSDMHFPIIRNLVKEPNQMENMEVFEHFKGLTTKMIAFPSENIVNTMQQKIISETSQKSDEIKSKHPLVFASHGQSLYINQPLTAETLKEITTSEINFVGSIPLQHEKTTLKNSLQINSLAHNLSSSDLCVVRADLSSNISDQLNGEDQNQSIPQLVVVNLGGNEWVCNANEIGVSYVFQLPKDSHLNSKNIIENQYQKRDAVICATTEHGTLTIPPASHNLNEEINENRTACSLAESQNQSIYLLDHLPTTFSCPTLFSAESDNATVPIAHLHKPCTLSFSSQDDDQKHSNGQSLNLPARQSHVLNLSNLDKEVSSNHLSCDINLEHVESNMSSIVQVSPSPAHVIHQGMYRMNSILSSNNLSCTLPLSYTSEIGQSNEKPIGGNVLSHGLLLAEQCITNKDYTDTLISSSLFGSAYGKVEDVCLDHPYSQFRTWYPVQKDVDECSTKSCRTAFMSRSRHKRRIMFHNKSYKSSVPFRRDCFNSTYSLFKVPPCPSPTFSGKYAISNYVIGKYAPVSEASKPVSVHVCDLLNTFDNCEKERPLFFSKNVPSCILNMDDIDIAYKKSDKELELPIDGSLPTLYSSGSQGTSTINLPVILPLQSEVFCSVSSAIHQHHLPKVAHLTNTTGESARFADRFSRLAHVPNVLENEQSSETVQCQKQTLTFSTTVEAQVAPDILVKLEQTGDKTSRHLLKDSSLKSQRNFESNSGKTEVKRCTENPEIMPTHKSSIYLAHVDSKEGRENVCKNIYKRKQSQAVVSVPGWFGKGLTLKKKKRW